jgi:hypothetical protein
MSSDGPSVYDYTRAEWMARDTRRDLAYEVARKLGYTRENANKTAEQVAAKQPGDDSPPRSGGRPSRHVSRPDATTGGGPADPFPFIRFPDAD